MNDSKKEAAFYDPRPDPDCFKKAKQCVLMALDSRFKNHTYDEKDLYVVWFGKTLDNWTALIGTDKALMYGDDERLYFEVTYVGLKGMTYVDRYTKASTKAISDAYLAATSH